MKIELVDFESFRQNSYRGRLRQLYLRIDATAPSYDLGTEKRKTFFVTAQGEFISVLRLKRQTSIESVAQFLKVSINDVEKIELGEAKLDDRDFFRLCTFLGGEVEASVFIEKMEKVMTPGMRDARRSLSKSLRSYGITFADE
ncbi:MAG: hypothetical protein K2Q26_03665 [Bdellovibrionales bacterium]|nr:hypothetical protein [Bdellovibrionales bacterium]